MSDIFAQGAHSARFDLPASTNKSACELAKGPRPLALGSDDYYALETRFPTNWQEPGGWGMTIAQLHFQYPPIWGGPLSLFAHANYVELVVQAGSCAYGTGCSTVNKQNIIPVGQLTLGAWHQFVIHAHWASNSTGVIEAWWRQRGQTTWNKTVSYVGVSVQFAPGTTPNTNQDTYDKIGAYRGAAAFPLSIWHDGFCTATSFNAAASCLN